MDQHPIPAVNAISPWVLAPFFVIVAVELAFMAGQGGLIGGGAAEFWRRDAWVNYGVNGLVLDRLILTGLSDLDLLKRFVSYPFVHWSFTSAAFVCAFLIALGKFVSEELGGPATLLVFILSSIGGGVAYASFATTDLVLVGGFPGAYGLIGAYSFVLFTRLGNMRQNQLQAFRLIGMLMVIQLVFGLFLGSSQDWIADLAGAVSGFVVAVIVSPGSVAKFLQQIRRD